MAGPLWTCPTCLKSFISTIKFSYNWLFMVRFTEVQMGMIRTNGCGSSQHTGLDMMKNFPNILEFALIVQMELIEIPSRSTPCLLDASWVLPH